MARVHQRAASSRPARARSKPTGHRKRPYKVILESVTQEKKRLYTVISFEAEAPPGYTFIPAGNPHLTNRCKELSREHGVKVLIVSTTPHKNHKSTLSHQVHRIGHHFPSWIVGQACMDLGLHISSSGHVSRRHDGGPRSALGRVQSRLRKPDSGRKDSTHSDVSQAKLNAEARDAIKDLFPKIPEADLNKIISRAFQKGKSRVGTASELSLPRRVQLAVVAHIRHVYTNYDRLLRTGTYHAARAQIEQKCLDQLVQWRGDGEDGTNDMEEILREVIVISDDEDDEADTISNTALVGRDSSVEIISSHALANDVHVRPMDYRDELVVPDDEQPYALEYMVPGIVHRVDQKYQGDEQRAKDRFGRRGFGRYRAWDQALDRYRKNPVHYSHPVNDVLTDHGNVSNKLRDDVYEYRPLQGVSESRSSGKSYGQFGERTIYAENSRPTPRQWPHDPHRSSPQYLGTRLQGSATAREAGCHPGLRPQPQPRALDDSAYHRSAANIGDFIDVSSGPSLHQTAIPSYLSQPEQILPSIEGFSHALTSSTSRRTDEGFPTRTKAQRSQSYAQQQMPAPTVLGYTPVMPRLVELDEHCDGHLTKRRRIANPAYESSNEMPPVTSRALPLEASGMSPSRVQWLDSGSLPMRQTHTNSIYVPELDSGSHQQRLGVLDRPQTTTGLAYHRRPRLRYTEHVYPDLPDQEPWNEVLRRPNGDFVDDIENRSPPFGRWNRGTQAPLDSRHPRFTTHHSEQLYESSVDCDRLSVFVHGPDHSSHSTQIISKASLRDDDQMIADPRGVHMVDPLRNTGQPPRFVRASEDDSFVHTDISTRTQLPSGEATGHQRFARENLVGAQGYAYYQQRPRTELPSEKYYPSPIPLLPGPTQRRNLVTSEYRQVEVHGLRQSYDKPQGIAAREQPVSWTHLNSRSEPLASVKVSDAPAWITSRAEQRRYIRVDQPEYFGRGHDSALPVQPVKRTVNHLQKPTMGDGRSCEAYPISESRREVIVLD